MRIIDLYLTFCDTQQVKIANVNGVSLYTGMSTEIPETLFQLKVRELYSTEKNIIFIII